MGYLNLAVVKMIGKATDALRYLNLSVGFKKTAVGIFTTAVQN
jgi:hypothetical protein